MKILVLVPLALLAFVINCQNKKDQDSDVKVDVKLPASVLADIPGDLAAEHSIIGEAISMQLASAPEKEIKISVKCEKNTDADIKSTAHHCRIRYSGPYIHLPLTQSLYGLATGDVHIGREKPEATIWLRTYDKPNTNLRTIEYCRIKGIEGGIGTTLGLGKWAPGYPDLDGLRLVLEKKPGPNNTTTFKIVEGLFDISMMGSYPNDNCRLSDET